MNSIREYIESGILEAYVLGSASETEERELLRLKTRYPQVQEALADLEADMERIAGRMAIVPPPGAWERIADDINALIVTEPDPVHYKEQARKRYARPKPDPNHYIEVESESNEMRVNKAWKWVFVAVFILGKIFLACAIYFYLENRQAQQQIEELKIELKQSR